MANVTIISEENMISQKYFSGNLFVRQTQMQKQVFALRNPSCEWNIKFFFNEKVRAAWILMYYWRVFEWLDGQTCGT